MSPKQEALRKLEAYIKGRESSSSRALLEFNASNEQKRAVSILSGAMCQRRGPYRIAAPVGWPSA